MLWFCYELTPRRVALRLSSEKESKIDQKNKSVCTQTETLADCHFIFKVDGTEERYSSASSRSLQPLFSTVSAVPDHISLDNLILTFRTRT